uniref:AMP-dependent synthetase/ligase domain-containing protein n=2 Tax=Pseudo-nitzschia australis TaxID=44445 RepID=A0A7S4EPR5_9STRA|mmetsp:Transcript_16773/g.34468  ORF Transcript_16773/g.34468 Transcript_16773/m.34468 type:complete len:699 (-) Transcript_16773:120-2216(-)|eukprot:CAMPEP_0168192524 /NCGR_PEP_ID=MMETSP0139_2-20121125/18096_1 /TAXON_ID=44445 /ORGANISM="Pseudo-nitzschia australis, Strain 10249 10 AB" /LENGTH=698 /DNA_ID=CAMNT_0008115773 /DNA_START=89 /DNA_END=2185 /DNA_ORIENTATION=+
MRMLTTKLRPFARRISKISHPRTASKSTAKALASAHNIEIPTSVSPTPRRFITTEQEKHFQERGFLDAQGMTAFNTLHELQVHSSHVFSENELFGTYQEQSKTFNFMTYDEYNQKVNQCRSLLKDLGIGEYSKVAIIANNRWEWATIAAATYSLNATLVPMYEAQLPSDWTYILNDASAQVVFCATQEIFDKVRTEVLPSTPSVKASLCLDAPLGEHHSFQTALSSSEIDNDGSLINAPATEDLAGLIYTSGTTGQPKGVELTHLNFTSNVKGATRSLVKDPKAFVKESDRSLSFLPWAHSYGQTCELWSLMSSGASMGVCRGVPVILEDLQLVKPTTLFSVPTLYKKVFDGVHNLMESAPPLRRKLMKNALAMGEAKVSADKGMRQQLDPFERIKFAVLDRLVLSKIRDRFGGNLLRGFSGGAASPVEVIGFMDNIGIPICEGYGLTETSPIITLNVPENRTIGSVGRPVGDVAVYIVDEHGNPVSPGMEGEICCVGPNVMKGYYNNKKATDEVISVAPDGKSKMFHTGDMGKMDDDGWVSVTGRIKEQYKLENGKYVVPTPIESAISMSRFINQVVLCGANRPHNVVLIVPEWPAIRAELGIGDDVADIELANDTAVKKLIDNEIIQSCAKLKKFEIPKEWAFVAPFTAANNMLTPKMSIRRHKVMDAYEELISSMYNDDAIVTEAADGALREAAA